MQHLGSPGRTDRQIQLRELGLASFHQPWLENKVQQGGGDGAHATEKLSTPPVKSPPPSD